MSKSSEAISPAKAAIRPTAQKRERRGRQRVAGEMIHLWKQPTVIARNFFRYKSLSSWACNFAVGCRHGCLFCYVPDASTLRLRSHLLPYGVDDPDAQWGEYLLVRPWDERKFLASLEAAERVPRSELNPDGNRAVMMCSTTDAYQTIRHPNPERQKELSEILTYSVRRALELILHRSSLNVRILTRSPLCRRDFDLFRQFGPRLLLGMSIPTLQCRLARVYEPSAPAPTVRLATMRAAKEHGLHVYAAIAPTYPECDAKDLGATLAAIAELDPVTIYSEPINVRAENTQRIRDHAEAIGQVVDLSVFSTTETWQRYATGALRTVEKIAGELGVESKLHLWPDASLGTAAALKRTGNPSEQAAWLERCWSRISQWPSPSSP